MQFEHQLFQWICCLDHSASRGVAWACRSRDRPLGGEPDGIRWKLYIYIYKYVYMLQMVALQIANGPAKLPSPRCLCGHAQSFWHLSHKIPPMLRWSSTTCVHQEMALQGKCPTLHYTWNWAHRAGSLQMDHALEKDQLLFGSHAAMKRNEIVYIPKKSILLLIRADGGWPEPFETVASIGPAFKHLVGIVKTIMALTKCLSEKLTLHYFGQSVCQLCTRMYPV